MNLPKRKQNRLNNYDYGQNGCYFITVCTKDRKKILSKIVTPDGNNETSLTPRVGADIIRPPKIVLSRYGKIVDDAIKNIENVYDNISISKHVIMPDHIHLIIKIDDDKNGRMVSAPTVVAGMKRYVSKKCGFPIWQKGFYDHVIRDQNDYNEKCEYIENNPTKRAIIKTDKTVE